MMLEISGIWTDVMRTGPQGDNHQSDAEWWLAHQKEIEFAFGVLSGLGLANPSGKADDGTVSWKPSRSMKRLHRYSRLHYDYRHARDKHLQANLAMQNACQDD
jgi:hypothetical protein